MFKCVACVHTEMRAHACSALIACGNMSNDALGGFAAQVKSLVQASCYDGLPQVVHAHLRFEETCTSNQLCDAQLLAG